MATPPVRQNFPTFSAPVVETNRYVTTPWRDFFQRVWQVTRNLGVGGPWGLPTGTGSRATFNMDAAYPVSNPPTQAEVQAIATGLVEVRKRLGQLIQDQVDAGTIT